MTAENLTVAGRRFRTRSEYEAALRDQKKIEHIKKAVDFNSPKQVYELLSRLKSGAYRFETSIGTDFDDEIFEKTQELKRSGITAANAETYSALQDSGKVSDRKQKKSAKASGGAAAEKALKIKKIKRSEALAGKADSGANVKGNANATDLSGFDKKMQEQIQNELKKRERGRKLIIAMASLVAAACFGYFGVYYFFAERTSSDYEKLSNLKGSAALANAQEKNTFSINKVGLKLPDVLDEYKTLYEKNKKLIGWLKIDDTNIDYPVMQTTDNEYYLDHNYSQEYDRNGSLFLDCNCSVYPASTNMIIYGHHMKSGNMFGNLQSYAKESYGEKHSVIQFDTIYEKAAYQVMYVFRSQVYNDDDFVFKYYQFIDANSEKEFNSYMEEMAGLSLYDTGVTASYGDSLLTLSTCDYSQTDGRFVVVAKRIG